MKKILVVGKDPKTCEDLRKHFDPQEYILLSSYDPKSAIASTINLKPDLIILDLNLPHHSGIEVLKKLKESNSNLPVIAITDRQDAAHSSSNLTEIDIIKEKVYAFVKRPIQPEKLSFMVKEALSTGANRAVHPTGMNRVVHTIGGNQRELKGVTKFSGISESPEKAKLYGSTAPKQGGVCPLPINCEKTLEGVSAGGKNYYQMFEELLAPIFDKIMVNSKSNIYDHLISSLEKSLLSLTLKYCNHNQVKASQILGISRNTLRERIKRYDLW
jgi:DNA-binding NtrC family response regulator